MNKEYSEERKREIRAVWERQKVGYRYMEVERARRIRETNHLDNLEVLMCAFEYAITHPFPKPQTGLVEYYQKVMKNRENGL